MLDDGWDLTNVTDRLAPLLEDPRAPFDFAGECVDLGLILLRFVLKFAQRRHIGTDFFGKILLFLVDPLDASNHFGALLIQCVEQAREQLFRFVLLFRRIAGDESSNGFLCFVQRSAPGRQSNDKILEHGIVYSHFNRPRRLPDVENENEGRRNAAVREGINSPIQGDGSDVTWVAGYRLQKWLLRNRMKSRVIVIVHDALYVDCHREELEKVIAKAHYYLTDRDWIKTMTGWYCSVAWDTDASVGLNLGDMIEMEHGKTAGEFIVPKEFAA